MTNNMVECKVVLSPLKELKELGVEHISMHSDSRLVVNQVMGTFKANVEKVKK